MKLLPQPSSYRHSKLAWLLLIAVVATLIFVPLNAYCQNVLFGPAITTFTDRDADNGALCPGPNIPAGAVYNGFMESALPARGFPFRIQAGGSCVPPDNTQASAADAAVAALAAVLLATGLILVAHKMVLKGKASGQK